MVLLQPQGKGRDRGDTADADEGGARVGAVRVGADNCRWCHCQSRCYCRCHCGITSILSSSTATYSTHDWLLSRQRRRGGGGGRVGSSVASSSGAVAGRVQSETCPHDRARVRAEGGVGVKAGVGAAGRSGRLEFEPGQGLSVPRIPVKGGSRGVSWPHIIQLHNGCNSVWYESGC